MNGVGKTKQGSSIKLTFPEFSGMSMAVAAPGRVNLIGEHIDYNDGFCLPMAIDRYLCVGGAPVARTRGRTASIYSTELRESITIPLDEKPVPSAKGWGRYVEGVIAGFMDRGVEIPSFDAVIQSDIPLGGGLSSSAALAVGIATLLEVLTGKPLEPMEKVLLCQQVEHRFAGVPCGIMDQFSSVFGKSDELMLLDCRSQQFQAIPFGAENISVVVTNSNVKHQLAEGEYAARRSQCDAALKKLKLKSWRDVTMDKLASNQEVLSATEYRRARHVVSEIDRTTAAAEAIRDENWSRAGELMYASHASLQTNFEVSCDELDILVEVAQEMGQAHGVYGSRMTGGGFGGCTVSLVESDQAEEMMRTLAVQFETRTGIRASSFASRPARGAHVFRG